MLPKDIIRDLKNRLASLNGQVKALPELLDSELDPRKIMTQFKAVRNGMDKIYELLLDEVFRKALAEKIVEINEMCPGNCGNELKIAELKRDFPMFNLSEIADKLKDAEQISEELAIFIKNSEK